MLSLLSQRKRPGACTCHGCGAEISAHAALSESPPRTTGAFRRSVPNKPCCCGCIGSSAKACGVPYDMGLYGSWTVSADCQRSRGNGIRKACLSRGVEKAPLCDPGFLVL